MAIRLPVTASSGASLSWKTRVIVASLRGRQVRLIGLGEPPHPGGVGLLCVEEVCDGSSEGRVTSRVASRAGQASREGKGSNEGARRACGGAAPAANGPDRYGVRLPGSGRK